jgi:exopolysaccharide biosynthesis WecB/TagA/CpsF family protein
VFKVSFSNEIQLIYAINALENVSLMSQDKTFVTRVLDSASFTHFERCTIGGIPIVTASRRELAEAMVQDCFVARANKGGFVPRLVFDVNGHGMSLRETNNSYRIAFDQADVVHADGGFLVALSKGVGKRPIAERSATTDLLHDCAAEAAAKGLSFYLLGCEERVNAECAKRLEARYPALKIVGRHHGFFQVSEEQALIEEINRCNPDVLWVGLGKPKEQIFSVKWRNFLRCGWIVTCGGCYNYVTGDYARAPIWMQKANIEWLHRMLTNRKLVWRYLTTTPHALFLALKK